MGHVQHSPDLTLLGDAQREGTIVLRGILPEKKEKSQASRINELHITEIYKALRCLGLVHFVGDWPAQVMLSKGQAAIDLNLNDRSLKFDLIFHYIKPRPE